MYRTRLFTRTIVLLALTSVCSVALAAGETSAYQNQCAAFIKGTIIDKYGYVGNSPLPYPDKFKALGYGIIIQDLNSPDIGVLLCKMPSNLSNELRAEIMDRIIMSLHVPVAGHPLNGRNLVGLEGSSGLAVGSNGLIESNLALTARGVTLLSILDQQPQMRGLMIQALMRQYTPADNPAGMQLAFTMLRTYSTAYVDDKRQIGDKLRELYNWIVNGTPPLDKPDALLKAVAPGGLSAGADILHSLAAYYIATGDKSAIDWGDSILQYLLDTYWIESAKGSGFSYRAGVPAPDPVASGEMIQAMYWFDKARFHRQGMTGK